MTRKARTMFTCSGLIVASALFNGCASAPLEASLDSIVESPTAAPVIAFCAFATVPEAIEAPVETTGAVTFHLGAGDELGAMVFEYMLVLGAFDTETAEETVYASAEFLSD